MASDDQRNIKVAILDMYEGVENQGMRCIREILNQFSDLKNLDVTFDEFDVRRKCDLPDLSYDIYISSGGPGSPIDSKGDEWENKFFALIDQLVAYNDDAANTEKKQVFFICHSFQLACRKFEIATISKRNSTSFGIFPVHFMGKAKNEIIFQGLGDPFFVVDSRDYQVVQPDHKKIAAMGASILLIEKARPHIPLERAIMAIRFNDFMVGTQFHPEADPVGMSIYLRTDARKKVVIENYGEEKWVSMLDHLDDPDKIINTYAHVLPNFLNNAVSMLIPELV